MRRDNSGFTGQTLAHVAKEFLEEIEKRILLSSKVEVDPQIMIAASEMSAEQKILPAWVWLNPEAGDVSYGRWPRVAGKVAPYIRADLALEAERRAEQRVRAEIGRDSERLDWLGSQDVVIGEFDSPEWKEVLLARYQRSMPADLADIRDTIDVAREVG
jgi:hypothetical protein